MVPVFINSVSFSCIPFPILGKEAVWSNDVISVLTFSISVFAIKYARALNGCLIFVVYLFNCPRMLIMALLYGGVGGMPFPCVFCLSLSLSSINRYGLSDIVGGFVFKSCVFIFCFSFFLFNVFGVVCFFWVLLNLFIFDLYIIIYG